MKRAYWNDTGFTLLEILVALALTGVASIYIYQAYISQHRSYVVQEDVTAMQQNARAAMFYMSRDLRMAGFGFGPNGVSFYDGSGTDFLSAITSFNTNPDRVDIIYADANVEAQITEPMPTSSAEMNVSNTNGFQDGDFVIVTDGVNASLLQITEVQDVALKLQHNPAVDNINPPGGHNIFPPGGYGEGALVFKLRYVSYDIGAADPEHPQLRIDEDGPFGAGLPQALAEDVEDLQLVYIFEDGGEDHRVDDGDGDDSNDSADIRAVRLSVLARTFRPDRQFNGAKPAVEDGPAGGPDHYHRRLLTEMCKVRNMGL